MEEKTKKWKELTNNQLLCTIVGAILGFVSAYIIAQVPNNPIVHDYIGFDSVTVLIERYFVDTGYVDDSILEVEGVDKQFEVIQSQFAVYDTAIEMSAVNLGLSEEKVSGMERNALISQVPGLAKEAYDDCQEYKEKNDELSSERDTLQEENDNYKNQKTVELIGSNIIIDGELMNNGDKFNNAVACVDGNNYYSQSFLNAFILDEKISYDVIDNTVVVGSSKPEKVKLSWDTVTNADGIETYKMGEGQSFTMDTHAYTEGIVLTGTDSFYIYLGGKYSKMSFTYGHIDNTNIEDFEITVFALDENNQATVVLKTIPLKGEMVCDEIEVPIGYAQKIKIVASGANNDYARYWAKFGLTDIYFYS